MDVIKNMFKINLKNFNIFTVLSILCFLAGFLFWIYWGLRYGIWYDIGIYAITIVFVVPGLIGILLSLMEKEEN